MTKPKIRRLFRCAGVFFTFVSLFGYALSLAMPGIGWVLAALSLTVNCLLAPWVGNRQVMLTFIVSAAHLLTLGPFAELAKLAALQAERGYLFAIVFIVAPFALAACTLLMPIWRMVASRLYRRSWQ